MTSEEAIVLKSIAKELHEMNKKLDRFGQASIFKKQSEIHVDYEVSHDFNYIPDCASLPVQE